MSAARPGFSLLRAFSVRFSLDIASRGVVFAVSILAARQLLVEDYGQFTYALSLANLFYVFTELGLHLVILREVRIDTARFRALWPSVLTLKLVLSAAALVAGCVLFPLLWPWKFSVILLGAMVWMAGNALFDFLQTVCNALHRFRLAALLALVYRGGLLIATSVLFARGAVTLGSLLTIFMICNVAATVISLRLAPAALDAPRLAALRDPAVWRLVKLSVPIGLANMFGMVYQRFDMLFLGWFSTAGEVGLYGAAYRLFEVMFMLPAALMAIATPLLSRARDEGPAALRAELARIGLLLGAAACAWLGLGFFNAPGIVRLLFGEAYRGAAPALRLLVLANVAVFVSQMLTYTLIVLGRERRHLVNQMVCFVLSGAAAFICIHLWQARGAALAIIITHVALSALSFQALRRHLWGTA